MEHTGVLETPETTGLLAIFGAFDSNKLLQPSDFDAFRAAISRANDAGETTVADPDMLLNNIILACAGREYAGAVDAGVPASSFSRLGKRPASATTTADAEENGGRPAQRQRAINSCAS